MGNDPVYNKSTCFDPFPFPDPSDGLKARIRDLGEQLDAHRKARQAAHPGLTMTGMYNVLEKLRAGEVLSEKEKAIHEKGLVSVLKQIHDDLDVAVFEAYGWPTDLSDEEILQRLVALNRERAEEEKRGKIRWLRPEFQAPDEAAAVTGELGLPETAAKPAQAAAKKTPWPRTLPEQVQAVRAHLAAEAEALSLEEIGALFRGARKKRLREVVSALVALGQLQPDGEGRFAAS